MVIWIIGLSGAGKTTLAKHVVALARMRLPNVVLLDGDILREALGNDLGHSLASRRCNAGRLCGLSKMLEEQGIHVVCAVLSLFPESRQWNREHLQEYYEVFIDTPMQDLVFRDGKGLYAKAFAGEIELPGVNMDFPRPEFADLVIENSGTLDNLLDSSMILVDKICKDI